MSAPLKDILVVALEHAVAAPFCSRLLADAGARVIKVERSQGDFARGYDTAVKGQSTYFTWLNYGKESLILNLKDSDDMAFLKRILEKADVLVQNFSPGALDRLGLGDQVLGDINQGLIHCAIQGYGDSGPYCDRKAYDLLIQAETGLAYVTGSEHEPSRVGVSVCDIATGLYAYASILESLIQRASSKSGNSIKISMFDAMSEWMAVPLLQYDYAGSQPKRVGLRHPSIAPYGVYTTSDNAVIVIAVQNDREWKKLCLQVFENTALFETKEFETNVMRVENRPALESIITSQMAVLDYQQCTNKLQASKIAYGDVNDISGLSNHPHLKRRKIVTQAGQVSVPASPLFNPFTDELAECPAVGQHTQSIRAEFS